MVSFDQPGGVGGGDALLDPLTIKVEYGYGMAGAFARTLEVSWAGHRSAEVLEERRHDKQRRGLRPEVALDVQGGAVGG